MKKKRNDKRNHRPSSSIGGDAIRINDKHHNSSSPCSNLALAIAQEIFPTFAQPSDVAEKNGSNTSVVNKSPRGGKSTTDRQPLLACMVQSFLIEERKKARAKQGIGTGGNSSKKKRNKKKRKKKTAATLANEGSDIIVGEVDARDIHGDENDSQPTGALTASKGCLSLLSGKENSSKEENKSLFGLDCLLDSLIGCDKKTCETRPRDLQAFSVFLARKIESHSELQQSRQAKEKAKALDTEINGLEYIDVLPTISISDVREQLNAINCRVCRTSAISHLRSLIREEQCITCAGSEDTEIEHLPTFVTNPTIILSSCERGPNTKKKGCILSASMTSSYADEFTQANEFETAHDYGIESKTEDDSAQMISSPMFHLELRPTGSGGIHFLQIGAMSEKGRCENGSIQKSPIDMQDIMNLVKYIILPCGLAQVSRGSTYGCSDMIELGEKELKGIATRSFESVKSIHRQVIEAQSLMTNVSIDLEKADKADKEADRSLYDMKTTSLLIHCDSSCEALLKAISELLIQIFKSVCFVGWSSEYGCTLLEFVFHLWEQYTDSLAKLLDPTMKHRIRVQAAASEGRVPLAFSSKVIRGSLKEMVTAKVSIIRAFVDKIRGSLQGSAHIRNLYLLEEYRKYVEPKFTVEYLFSDQEGDNLLKQLIDAQICLSRSCTHFVSIGIMKKKAGLHRIEVETLSRKVRKLVIGIEDFAPKSKVEFLDSAYSNHESAWYDLEKRLKDLKKAAGGEVEQESQILRILLKKSAVLVLQWILSLCSQQCCESTMSSLSIPPCLKRFFDNVSGADMPELMPGMIKQSCDGQGGERRVSSILASLIYRWLEARCWEWHAEMTRDELLQELGIPVELEIPCDLYEERKRNGKKKRSKRNKVKTNKDDMSDAQVQKFSSGIDDKKLSKSSKGETLEIHELKAEDDFIKARTRGESSSVEDESKNNEETPIIFEETGTYYNIGKGEEQRKQEQYSDRGDGRQVKGSKRGLCVEESSKSMDSENKENLAVAAAQVEKIEAENETDAQHDDSNGIDAEVGSSKILGIETNLCTDVAKTQIHFNRVETTTNACVIDGHQVIPAEMYLVKRLQVIIGLKGLKATPTKNVPLVWM